MTTPNQMAEAQEREAFEAWRLTCAPGLDLSRNMPGREYNNPRTHEHWLAWQARAALAAHDAQPSAELPPGSMAWQHSGDATVYTAAQMHAFRAAGVAETVADQQAYIANVESTAAQMASELEALRLKLDAAYAVVIDLGGEVREPELDEQRRLRADAERLDWLDSQFKAVVIGKNKDGQGAAGWMSNVGHWSEGWETVKASNLRAAIDAARKGTT